jgi:hypothetical protein
MPSQEDLDAIVEAKVAKKLSLRASKGANAKNRENHAMRQQVWEWYATHRGDYCSMDAAAEAVVTSVNLVPAKFRTVRKWIGDFVKNEKQSASTL